MKSMFGLCLLIFLSFGSYSQSDERDSLYLQTFLELDSMLKGHKTPRFKRAVFIVENSYLNNKIRYDLFETYIDDLVDLAKDWMLFNTLKDYKLPDSSAVLKNLAIYKVIRDTITIQTAHKTGIAHLPYTYDFDDFSGKKDWSKMFVTKLMAIHSGNCHSLPYLYKIIADELAAPCWLSLAPNHIYIKNRCKKIGWYNTELTSGNFPIDAWITTSGYIPLKAIQTGIYMDTLSNQQAIALCMLDLAKGYEFQAKNYYNGFILKCCNQALQYHPANAQALLLKAETLKRIYRQQQKEKNPATGQTYKEMEDLYVKLFDLGYREMPEKMYTDWLKSLAAEKEKFANKKMGAINLR